MENPPEKKWKNHGLLPKIKRIGEEKIFSSLIILPPYHNPETMIELYERGLYPNISLHTELPFSPLLLEERIKEKIRDVDIKKASGFLIELERFLKEMRIALRERNEFESAKAYEDWIMAVKPYKMDILFGGNDVMLADFISEIIEENAPFIVALSYILATLIVNKVVIEEGVLEGVISLANDFANAIERRRNHVIYEGTGY